MSENTTGGGFQLSSFFGLIASRPEKERKDVLRFIHSNMRSQNSAGDQEEVLEVVEDNIQSQNSISDQEEELILFKTIYNYKSLHVIRRRS